MAVCCMAFGLLVNMVSAQAVTQQDDDPVTIVGTWSTGSGQVETGLVSGKKRAREREKHADCRSIYEQNFYNPINNTFNIPRVGGQSYSFTEDGFWEQSLFIFEADRK